MPFLPQALAPALVTELQRFVDANSFVNLYQAYSWRNDTYEKGFPDIRALESRLAGADLIAGVTLDDVKGVVAWGALRNQGRVAGQSVVAPPYTFRTHTGAAQPALAHAPLAPLWAICERLTRGVGPTYLSKVLRFSLPQEYGAIDTRLVRVFGCGDPDAHRYDWLKLQASNSGYGWYIAKNQRSWPDDYVSWVNILRYFASVLPANCPHPATFIANGLRKQGVWLCADVEMALFAYASRFT
jgi:hypothetical protein